MGLAVLHQLQHGAVLHQTSRRQHDELPQPSGRRQVQVLRRHWRRKDRGDEDQVEDELLSTSSDLLVGETVRFRVTEPGRCSDCLQRHNCVAMTRKGLQMAPDHILCHRFCPYNKSPGLFNKS